MAQHLVFHLIANAHLDPVWLWDWREGLNEGIITCRTILDLMDEYPQLTCIRGEAALYEHIEHHDPETFTRIRRQVASGRWDVVGGVYVQPDTNLPATETMCRQFVRAQRYFTTRFGRPVRVGWAADSFGHSAGLPGILNAAGIRAFAFTRPEAQYLPLAKPAFWWDGGGGGRVMGYRPLAGWYGCERDEIVARLDKNLAAARLGDLQNVGLFYGLGDHGGGPTRRQLKELAQWADAHPEVTVLHSGLHRLFDALFKEVARKGGSTFLPVHRGELNFCQRGCYVSVAKFKSAFRRGEAHVGRAENCAAALSVALRQPARPLADAWDALLFNAFHDILPGSSIERAYDDQLAWLGHARHLAATTELAALNALALAVDTRRCRAPAADMPGSVVFLAWNPHAYEYRGPLELETALDWRPIAAYAGRPDALPVEVRDAAGRILPFQSVATEHSSFANLPWRKRLVIPVRIPALGWTVLEAAYVEGARNPAAGRADPVTTPNGHTIDNGIYRVSAHPGANGIQIQCRGRALFGAAGLNAITVEDPWGSWGGQSEEPAAVDLSTVRHTWRIARVAVLDAGPERATLAVRLCGGASELDLHFVLYRQRAAVDVQARVLWNERSARLKLVMPDVGDRAEFDVMGAVVTRGACGEVPGGRWVRVHGAAGAFGFASDALYGFDLKDGALRASVLRASRYANDQTVGPRQEPWRTVVDRGEFSFRFVLTPGDATLPRLARELEQPILAVPVPPKPGHLPRAQSLLCITPANLQVNALKPAEAGRGLILRMQETAGRTARAKAVWQGARLDLGVVGPHGLASWRLSRTRDSWRAVRCSLME